MAFVFYKPDPALTAWTKEDNCLKKAGVSKKDRPVMPKRNSLYPTKTQLALRLRQEFKDAHGAIKIKAILTDVLYGEKVLWTKPHAYLILHKLSSSFGRTSLLNIKLKKELEGLS